MRAFERRAEQAYPYFKLASWDARSCVWRAGRKAYTTIVGAREDARKPGKYRITIVAESGYTELEPFEVT